MLFFPSHRLYKLLTESFTAPTFSDPGPLEMPILGYLTANVGQSDTVLPCSFNMVPPAEGYIWVDKELIRFQSDDGVTLELKNCKRAYEGTLSESHLAGTELRIVPVKETELSRIVRMYESQFDTLYEKIKEFIKLKDIDSMPAHILPFQSEELGWALNISKTVSFQRKWVKILVPMYKRKGTKMGIKQIVYFLTGFKGQVYNYFDAGWALELDKINIEFSEGTTTESGEGKNLFHNIGVESQYNIQSIVRDSDGLVTVQTTEQTCGIKATVTGTAIEPFDIREFLGNNKFKIRIDNNTGRWTEFEIKIPDIDPNPALPSLYTAKELANTIRNRAYVQGIVYSDDGTGKLKINMDIVGKKRKFEILSVADSCYATIGLSLDEYAGTDGLVVRNRINIIHSDWTLNGNEEIDAIVDSYTFKCNTDRVGTVISYGAGGLINYVDPRAYITHTVKSTVDKDEVTKMLNFQRPASNRDHNIWTLFYDDFSQDLAGGSNHFWKLEAGTAILQEEDETLSLGIRGTGGYIPDVPVEAKDIILTPLLNSSGIPILTSSGLLILTAIVEPIALASMVGEYLGKAIRVTDLVGDRRWRRYTALTEVRLERPEFLLSPLLTNAGVPICTSSGLPILVTSMEQVALAGVVGKYLDQYNYYAVEANTATNTVSLVKVVGGIKIVLHQTDYGSLSSPPGQTFEYHADFYRLRLDCELITDERRQVLFYDSFESGELWKTEKFPISFSTSNMLIAENAIALIDQDLSGDVLLWTNTFMKIKAKTTANAVLEILFRIQAKTQLGNPINSLEECFVIVFEPRSKRVKLVERYIDPILGPKETIWASASISWLYPETYYNIWIEADGNHIRVQIDGEVVIDTVNGRYATGNFGLRSKEYGTSQIAEIEIQQLLKGTAPVQWMEDVNDYRSFTQKATFVGENFWLVDYDYQPPTTELSYYIEENFLGRVQDNTFLSGKAGILSEKGTSIFKAFEVIGLPKDETLIAYDEIS